MDEDLTKQMQTPMMQQYMDIKKEYPDCLLFYRMGDFYELFLEDAEIASKLLDITLTARNKGSDGKIPMCGVPFHSVDQYLAKIVQSGYKAAICEQVSKPTPGKDLVQRKVIRIITPGTVIDENLLDKRKNNYLLVFSSSKSETAIVYSDISTGEFNLLKINSINLEQIKNEIKIIAPSEIVLSTEQYKTDATLTSLSDLESINLNHYEFENTNLERGLNRIKDAFGVKSLSVFEIDETDQLAIEAINKLLDYLEYTQKGQSKNLSRIKNHRTENFLRLDSESILNLELFRSNKTFSSAKDASFINLIDKTQTPMGARLLREWVIKPLVSKKQIDSRLSAVKLLTESHNLRSNLLESLKKINDIERIMARLGSGTGNARDLRNLTSSLDSALHALEIIKEQKEFSEYLSNLSQEQTNHIKETIQLINDTIVEEPPFSIREGRMIKEGVNEKLDEINSNIESSKFWIENLETTEKQLTGISNLKVGFNSVFGYYIEVTKSNTHMVPDHYHRKQTLVNAERYITQELKEKEDIVLSAKEKIDELEFEIFSDTVRKTFEYIKGISILSTIIANIDCLCGFAVLALDRNYVLPNINEENHFDTLITEGRHPVVESVLNRGEFAPNSTDLNKKAFLHLITGPNMAGKSTYIRQVALIQIMAQMGSFVPAEKTEISIVDAVYTRIGAGDALAQGLSTFMVEMIETAKILNNATKNSLIILDEVGRGTSTIDGLSIAQAAVEFIHNKIGAKTLFATHFHELTDLDQRLKHLENYHVGIAESEGEIKFLHKVSQGGTDKSYGIEVAKLAGVPEEVINRAKQILNKNTTNQLKLSL